jgi:hypothetical protein
VSEVAELKKQLFAHQVNDFVTHFRLACGLRVTIAVPTHKVGVIVSDTDEAYDPPQWVVIRVSRTEALNGDAVQRLKTMIEARKLNG